jgi:hypothetical protein
VPGGHLAHRATCRNGAGGPADVQFSGGDGVSVTIDDRGRTTVSFTDMTPVAYRTHFGDTRVSGQFRYAGRATGQLATGTGDTGDWRTVGSPDWSDTRVSVDITEPTDARLLENVPLDRYTGGDAERTGNAVDTSPLLADGTYRCEGGTVTVTPTGNRNLTWTLRKA